MSVFEEYVKPFLETVTALGTLVALVGLAITVYKNQKDDQAAIERDLLEQCKRSLEWAYSALMPDLSSDIAPASRLNWLISARHILAYKEIKKSIKLQPQLRICNDFEEFWRHRFYLALSHQRMSGPGYWSDPSPLGPENIEIRSALVVVAFSNWSGVDQIDSVDAKTLLDGGDVGGNAGRGLRAYIENVSNWKEQHRLNKRLETTKSDNTLNSSDAVQR